MVGHTADEPVFVLEPFNDGTDLPVAEGSSHVRHARRLGVGHVPDRGLESRAASRVT